MNSRGHPETLVATHPGNRNALKAGVFSPETLASRVGEVEAQIAESPVDVVLTDVLRREVAALAVLGEAMDRSLADDGLHGRRGEPRRLIELRLRLNEKLRRTLDRYEQTVQSSAGPPSPGDGLEDTVEERPRRSLAETIVGGHGKDLDDAVTASEFDPVVFLHVVIVTEDRCTRPQDVIRARRMLTRRRAKQPPTCACLATLQARDAIELREWIEEMRQSSVEPAPVDHELAAIVRTVARGDTDHLSYSAHRRTMDAIRHVVAHGMSSDREGAAVESEQRVREDDPAVGRFWRTLLSTDARVKTKDRLDAFHVLDEMKALPRCTCKPEPEDQLEEFKADAWQGFVVRIMAQTHYRAALIIARYPQTYLAVRDSIDEATIRALEDADRTSEPDAAVTL